MTAWASAHPAVAAWLCAVMFFAACGALWLAGKHLLDRDAQGTSRRVFSPTITRAWRRLLGATRRLPGAVKNLVPGAGVSSHPSPVTTATCPGDDTMTAKVDSPAPENVPGDSPAEITKIAGHGGSPDQAVKFAGGLRLPGDQARDERPWEYLTGEWPALMGAIEQAGEAA